MPIKYVSSWDPGGSTGVCVGIVDPTVPAGFQVVCSAVIPWANRFSRIRALLDHYRPTTTIVESFRLYKAKAQDQIGSNFPSAQVIGIIEAYLFMCGLAMPIYQPAALIAGQPPVKVLPEHVESLYKGTAVDMAHSNDAYLHMRYWIEQQRRRQVKPLDRGL